MTLPVYFCACPGHFFSLLQYYCNDDDGDDDDDDDGDDNDASDAVLVS